MSEHQDSNTFSAMMNPTRRACLLAFATAFVTLSTQVLVHRIVAAKLLNNYAFLVISLTMLGFAFSGIVLSRYLKVCLANLNRTVTVSAALFVITMIGGTIAFYRAPVGPQFAVARPEFITTFLKCIPFSFLYFIPFALCGLVLGVLLSSEFSTRRIYAYDLLGSALGAVLIIPAINLMGVELSLLLSCAVLLMAACVLFQPAGVLTKALSWTCALALVAAALGRERLFQFNYPDGSLLAHAGEENAMVTQIEATAWDATSRIEMSRIRQPDPENLRYACLVGDNTEFLKRFKRVLTQNNYAFTYAVEYDGKRSSLEGIDQTIYGAAYLATAVSNPAVAVIGVGGGFDVLAALYYRAQQVDAIEVNGATVKFLTETFKDYFQPWVSDPRVRLRHAEGRNYLQLASQKYDVIQLSGVDSFSGTPGGAHVFSESYLYSVEAFRTYLDRLTDQGVMCLMRLEYVPPREMLRALTTAIHALRQEGTADPFRHIILLNATNQEFTSLLVKRSPFTENDVQRVITWANGKKYFRVVAAPGRQFEPTNFYQELLALNDPRKEEAFLNVWPFNVRPVSDDKPFFFHYSYWKHLFSDAPLIKTSTPVVEYSLIILFVLTSIFIVICVYLPLRMLRLSPKTPGTRSYLLVFAGCGLGYMAIEIGLIQKYGLFLGHPNWAFSIVLGSLLAGTGIGSLYSSSILRRLGNISYISFGVVFLVLLLYFVHPLILKVGALPLAFRCALVFLAIFPLGVLLGVYMPTALDQVKTEYPSLVPWGWGVNGIFSVLSPIISVAVSMTWGINNLLFASILVYLAVGLVFPKPAERRAENASVGTKQQLEQQLNPAV